MESDPLWIGFTPGVIGCSDPWLIPMALKLLRRAFAGLPGLSVSFLCLEFANFLNSFIRSG